MLPTPWSAPAPTSMRCRVSLHIDVRPLSSSYFLNLAGTHCVTPCTLLSAYLSANCSKRMSDRQFPQQCVSEGACPRKHSRSTSALAMFIIFLTSLFSLPPPLLLCPDAWKYRLPRWPARRTWLRRCLRTRRSTLTCVCLFEHRFCPIFLVLSFLFPLPSLFPCFYCI